MSSSADPVSPSDDDADPHRASPDRRIEIALPARPEMAATLRVMCASLGADVGFSVDEIDDLKLAVNEVFTSAADSADPDRLLVSFEPGDGAIRVTIQRRIPSPIELDGLASTILRSVVDELSTNFATISFTKRRDATTD